MDNLKRVKCLSCISITVLLLATGCGKGAQHEAEEHKKPARKHKSLMAKKLMEKKQQARKGKIIGGDIDEDRTLQVSDSPYIVNRNLTVLPDVKLVIEPGVELKVAPYTSIVIKGNLHAMGTEKKRIRFTASESDELWDGIYFTDESFDYKSDELIQGHGCIIEYCKFEKAKTAIISEASSPIIRHNIFTDNEEGIKCRNRSNSKISYNILSDNVIGITCEEYSSPEITHNTIIGDEGKGINCTVYSSPLITYNTIFGKGDTWWKGVTCHDSSEPRVNYNNIYANGGHNVFYVKLKPGEKSPDIDATNNWWGMADKEEISKMIQDKYDKGDLGEVKFVPFAKSKIENADHKG